VDVRKIAFASACAVALLLFGCPAKPTAVPDAGRAAEPAPVAAPPLGEIRVSYLAPPEVSSVLAQAEVEKMVRERLLMTGTFGTAGPDPYQGEALVVCVLKQPRDSEPTLRAAVNITLDSASAPKLLAKMVAERPVGSAFPKGPKRRELLHAFLLRALTDAAHLIAVQSRLERAPTSVLVESVRNPDRDVRDHAVQILGVRRAPEAVAALIEALGDNDGEVAQHAIGALVSIGDARATPKIIELTRHKGGFFLVQLLYALGSLGGKEAEAFLWSVSQGHPEHHARRAAGEALETLRKKKGP
jgi:hypothetical protein